MGEGGRGMWKKNSIFIGPWTNPFISLDLSGPHKACVLNFIYIELVYNAKPVEGEYSLYQRCKSDNSKKMCKRSKSYVAFGMKILTF
jgi:hypothetical protein